MIWATAIAAATLAGCTQNTGGVSASPADARTLSRRAHDLLVRAAHSDIDVVQAHAIEALVQLDGRESVTHYRSALDAESPLVRMAGCRAIGDVRDTASMNRVRERLNDSHPLVGLAAAYAVYRCGDKSAGAHLVQALASQDEALRSEAAYLIGKLGDKQATRRLRYASQDRTNSNKVLMHIYAGLAMLGDVEAQGRIIQYSQGDAMSRLIALQTLVENPDSEARDALRVRLADEQDYPVNRLMAARALGKIGSKDGYDFALEMTRYVSKIADDPHDQMRVRFNAALALGDIRDRRALGVLASMAETETDERVQVAAAYAICRLTER